MTSHEDRREPMTDSETVEPSLEDILASIRRIISEEGPAVATASPSLASIGAASNDDVLVLTRRAPKEDHEMSDSDDRWTSSAHQPSPDRDVMHGVASEASQAAVLEVAPDPVWCEAGAPEDEPVVAPQTEAAAAAALDRLSAAAHGARPVASLMMPAPGRSIEDVVRELMRPMIKEWLDENLPAIVEARVDEEVERIARRRVR